MTRELTKKLQDEGIILKAEEIALGMVCAIQATNRQVLVVAINQYADSNYFDGTEGKVYLHVSLSGEKIGCEGCSADYATEADVPYHSVPCSCGNPKHWLIKYDEEGSADAVCDKETRRKVDYI